MSRPIRWSIAAAVVAGAVFGGGVALGQGPEPSASVTSGGPVGSAAPSMVPTSASPAPDPGRGLHLAERPVVDGDGRG